MGEINSFSITFRHILYGRLSIELRGNKLSLTHSVPTGSMFSFFPAPDVILSDMQLKSLLCEINTINFNEWKSVDLGIDDGDYQAFSCEYSSDDRFEFFTQATPPETFNNLSDIILKNYGDVPSLFA